jgi:cytochrome d ubiquinol oxidase subunit I
LFLHTVSAAYILSAFFVMGISAYHLLKRHQPEIFEKSFRLALALGLIFSVVEVFEGHLHGSDLAEIQPAKLALLEAHWETAARAPVYLLAFPDEKNERNSIALFPIPGALSLLAKHDINAEVKGLKDFPPGERPPVLINFLAFKIMVALGVYFVLMTLIGWVKRNRLSESPGYLKLMLYSIPLPYIASQAGWILTEVGRQPWIVYGLMKTSDAATPVGGSQVFLSLVAFILVYGFLGALGFYLMAKHARRGYEPAKEGQDSLAGRQYGAAERG